MSNIVKTIGTAQDYSTITLWEASGDSGAIYAAGDTAEGRCINQIFDERPTINCGGTIGLVGITLTAIAGQRHNGLAGTGARIVPTGTRANVLTVTYSAIPVTVSWLEISAASDSGSGSCTLLNCSGGSSGNQVFIHHNLIHTLLHSVAANAILTGISSLQSDDIHNNFIYRLNNANTSSGATTAITYASGASRTCHVYNNSVYNIVKDNGTGTSWGIRRGSSTTNNYSSRNNVVLDVTGTTSGGVLCFSGTTSTQMEFCASSDTTAIGPGSLISITSANNFVSTVAGSENLHLIEGANCRNVGLAIDWDLLTARDYNGTDEYHTIASNASLQAGDINFWISGWIHPDTIAAGTMYILGKGSSITGTSTTEYYIYRNGVAVAFVKNNTAGGTVTTVQASPSSLETTNAHFFLAYHDADNDEIGIFLDGSPAVTAATSSGMRVSTQNFSIGRHGSFATTPFDGKISNVAIGKPTGLIISSSTYWASIRDILFNYGKPLYYSDLSASLKTSLGLVSWWALNEAANADAVDSHGTNTLTDTNTVPAYTGTPGITYSMDIDNLDRNNDRGRIWDMGADELSTFSVTASGGLNTGGSATAGFAYSATGSGGVVLGGSATVTSPFNVTASGGISLTADAPVTLTTSVTVSGTIVLGGAGIDQATYVESSFGSINLGGSALAATTFTETSTGGIILGGSAPLSQVIVLSSSGTITLGGTADAQAGVFASGGAVFGGTALLAFTANATASGGVVLGGSAPIGLVTSYEGTGGLALSGAATIVISVLASGSINLGGTSQPETSILAEVSGGISLCGTVTTTSEFATEMSGGIVLGGTVPAVFPTEFITVCEVWIEVPSAFAYIEPRIC